MTHGSPHEISASSAASQPQAQPAQAGEFYARWYLPLYRHRIAEAGCQVDLLCRWMNLRPPALVADIGCGFGRHSIPLAARGFQVVAVDLQLSLLRALAQSPGGGLVMPVCADLQHLPLRPGILDAALLLFFVLAHLPPRQQRQALARLRAYLRPSGWLAVEMPGPALSQPHGRSTWQPPDAPDIVVRDQPLPSPPSELRILRTIHGRGRSDQFELSMHLHSPASLEALLRSAGWQPVRILQDWGSSASGPPTSLLALARPTDSLRIGAAHR